MGSLLSKIADMEADGTLPFFDKTNYMHVLDLARERGLRSQIMFDAMDMIREDTTLTNSDAVLRAATHWHLI